jgi:2-dehydro-3-deoxy-D-gluconate 5-dehydrogenase
MKLFDIHGKIALVTGGNGGIGLGMAEGLAAAGARIVVAGRDVAKSADAVVRLEALGTKAFAVSVDVASPESCARAVAATVERFGGLDCLVNNAGINIRKPPELYTPGEWREVLAINLDGAYFMAQAAHGALKARGGGKIINTGSMMSLFGSPFAAAYAASKGGIVQLTKSLAAAWASDNIQVNAILPGWIDTALTQRARAEVPTLNDRVLARTPQKRWGKPEDFAGIAIYLASPASDFVTGASFAIDGGYSAMM